MSNTYCNYRFSKSYENVFYINQVVFTYNSLNPRVGIKLNPENPAGFFGFEN